MGTQNREIDILYRYPELFADEIRLFHLDAEEEGELRGRLVIFRLLSDEVDDTTLQEVSLRVTDIPIASDNYDALSYCWGTGEKERRIKIYDEVDGIDTYMGIIEITSVLETVLVHFRSMLENEPLYRYFWIDIVCIDQKNDEEKSRQIQKMAAIYDQAYNVRVWLGPTTESSAIAMEFVKHLVNLSDIDKLTKDPGTLKQWTAFMELMQLPWFNRRWIIQELAMAREPIIYCGNQTVSWEEFTYAVDIFVAKAPELRKLFKRSPLVDHDAEYLGELDALGAKTLVECTTNLFRKDERGAVVEHLYSLERLLASLTMFETSKPLDTFYAIVWLAYDATPRAKQPAQRRLQNAVTPMGTPDALRADASDELLAESPVDIVGPSSNLLKPPDLPSMAPLLSPTTRRSFGNQLFPPPSRRGTGDRTQDRTQPSTSLKNAEKHIATLPRQQFKVDYKKSVFEVCKDFLEFAIRSSRSLDIICISWAPKPEDAESPEAPMPSWIPTVADRVYQRSGGSNIYARVRADPLVGNLGPHGRPYRASGKQRAYKTNPIRDDGKLIIGRRLTTLGFVLDEVNEIGDTSAFGVIPKSWLDLPLVAWSGYDDYMPPSFWRTLVADKGPDGYSHPPAYFPLACKWAFKQRTKEQGLSTNRLLNPDKCPELAFKFVRRVQAVIWHRRMLCTRGITDLDGREKNPPLLVLAPSSTVKGDLICILYGCSVPVVLRKNEAGSASGATTQHKRLEPRKRRGDTLPRPRRRQMGLSDVMDPDSLAAAGQHLAELPGSAPPITELEGSLGENRPPAVINVTEISPSGPSRTGAIETSPDAIPIKNITELPEGIALTGGRYEFIGQCYVHGYMNGEAFAHQDLTGNPLREFVLV
jgi:hypothetical protein